MANCVKCGKKIVGDVKFCPPCGAAVKSPSKATAAKSPPKAAGELGRMAYSADGANWTRVADSVFNNSIDAVAYANNRWVAGGYSGTMAYSEDGVTWTAVPDSTIWDYTVTLNGMRGDTKASIRAIAYGNNRFVAGGDNGKIAYADGNGIAAAASSSGTTASSGASGNSSASKPSKPSSDITYRQAIAKLDEIITYCNAHPSTRNSQVAANAKQLKDMWEGQPAMELVWPSIGSVSVTSIDTIIDGLE